MPRSSTISASGNGVTWNTGTYQYDGSGNIKIKGSDSYAYDSAGRIVQGTAYAGGNVWQRYGYDSFGNLTRTENWLNGSISESRLTPTDPTSNHMQTNGAGYDAGGNLTSWQGWTYMGQTYAYSYDPLSNLVMLVGNAAPAYQKDWTYFYTADDERIWQYNNITKRSRYRIRGIDNKPLREFTRDGWDLNQPFGAQGTWSWPEDWIWREGTIRAAKTPTQSLYFHLDHLGTPRVVSSSAASGRYDSRSYYPFGEDVADATAGNGDFLRFTGHESDVLSFERNTLDYMHARFYSPISGRFLSVDPVIDVKVAMTNPQAWNRYAYVRNNPLRWTDPTGKYTCDGTKAQCKAIEASLTVVRSAANEASRTRQPGATRLNSVVALYGKAGEKNGVSVVVKATGVPGATGSAVTKGNQTTLTVDAAYLNNVLSTGRGYIDLAKTAAHEGDHALNQRADPSLQTSISFSDLLFSERSAWRTENYINSVLGIPDSAASIWMPGVGWSPATLESTARANAAADCSLNPGGCTP